MPKQNVAIVVVDDDTNVLEALYRDLTDFEGLFRIETAESAEAAKRIINDLMTKGISVGLILCDHLMPGENGVEFMSKLHSIKGLTPTRKVLITAHAGLEDTIKAVNEANLNYYISKPWDAAELKRIVRHELTNYVVTNKDDLMKYMSLLETETIMNALQGSHSID